MSNPHPNPSRDGEKASGPQMNLAEACERLSKLAEKRADKSPAITRFRARGMDFEAEILTTPVGEPAIKLKACLGFVPFTAEDEYTRRALMEIIRSAAENIPARLRVDQKNRVWLVQETILDHEPVQSDLITLLTQLVLHLRPMLDLLEGRMIPLKDESPTNTAA